MERGNPDGLGGLFDGLRPDAPFGLDRKIGMEALLAGLGTREPEPTRVGRYLVREKLGEGGMGVVYRADDLELERSVALKVMRMLTTESEREAILHEARALARLAHPNVVTVHDMGTAAGQLYLTMEYVPGSTLRQWLLEPVTRSWREIVRLFIEAGHGLAAAHAAGIVHRDFKPENVLIGNDGRVRVLDFGLAHRARIEPGDGSDTTLDGGTPRYMAPEARHGSTATAASDQYSFCVALGEALAGRVEGAGPADEPPQLWAVVETGTSPSAEGRFRDMQALLEALDRVLVAPVADEQREQLLARIEEVWAAETTTAALVHTPLVPLPLQAEVTADEGAESGAVGARGLPAGLDTRRLAQLLARADGSLLLLAPPGAGKTTSLLQLTGQLLDQARRDTSKPVPVVVNLASFGDAELNIEDWLAAEVFTRYGIPARQVRRRLKAEAWVLLLDGLDEVRDDRRDDCVREINRLLARHPCPTVVACRSAAHARLTETPSLRGTVRIASLDESHADAFIESLGPMGLRLGGALARDPERRRHLQTPLLLTLAAMGGEDWAPDESEARLRTGLYRDLVDRALGSGAHEDPAMRRGLCWLAATMRARGLTELWVERLQADWLPDPASRRLARGLGFTLVLVIIFAGALSASVFSERSVLEASIIAGGCVPIALLFNRGLRIRPVDALRWSWRRSARWLPRSASAGLLPGALFGLVDVLWFNVVAGVMAGVIVSLPLGLESSDEVTELRPNRSIRRSLLNALVVGSVTGLITGLSWGYVLNPLGMPYLGPESLSLRLEDPNWASLCTGFFAVGTLSGMAAGGTAVVLHGALRVVLALRTPVPLTLVSFLEQAADRGLLRRVGGGYVFLHRTFQEYLASTAAEPDR